MHASHFAAEAEGACNVQVRICYTLRRWVFLFIMNLNIHSGVYMYKQEILQSFDTNPLFFAFAAAALVSAPILTCSIVLYLPTAP